jgi:prepilin-type N-terminal cleavage/methylation domain-containing protein
MPSRLRPRRRTHSGFTLPELMAVIAIVGVMAAIAMAALGRSGDAENAAALARSLQTAMMTARSATLSDGIQRRIACTPATALVKTSCTVSKYSLPGMAPLTTGTWIAEQRLDASSHATVWSVTKTLDVTTSNAGGTQATSFTSLYFRPDGTICDALSSSTTPNPCTYSTGMTFYISDTVGTNTSNQYKIYVYPTTGMPRMVNRWN